MVDCLGLHRLPQLGEHPVRGVLVDTHIALWALGDPSRLTDSERAVLVDPSVDRRLSPVSIWEAAAELPRHHGDPFDRVLIAHALRDDLSVLTRDSVFAAYGVRRAACETVT